MAVTALVTEAKGSLRLALWDETILFEVKSKRIADVFFSKPCFRKMGSIERGSSPNVDMTNPGNKGKPNRALKKFLLAIGVSNTSATTLLILFGLMIVLA